MKNCIINVAIREPYVTLQNRLLKSLEPFSSDFDVISWTNEYPCDSDDLFKTNYGFKVYAFKEAMRRGYTNILWLDAACFAVQSPKLIFDIISSSGYFFTGGNDVLSRNISDYYLDKHNILRDDVANHPLPSGSIYGFDIETKIGSDMLNKLYEEEKLGYFMDCYVDDSARIDGNKTKIRPHNSNNQRCDIVDSHRHDEAVLGYWMIQNNCVLNSMVGIIRANKSIGYLDPIVIDEHTFDKGLLHKTSKVLDCGARGFHFSRWIISNIKCKVTAIDADPTINDPAISGLTYINSAVSVNENANLKYYLFGNGTGSYTSEVFDKPSECVEYSVPTYVIKPGWDLIKMDVEGAEYTILMNMTEPLANQISVEFHEHTPARKGDEYMNRLFEHMSRWYNIHNQMKEPRHGCEPNYWDVLFILK